MTRMKNAQTAIGFLVVLLLLRQFAKRADASASASVAGWPVLPPLLLLPGCQSPFDGTSFQDLTDTEIAALIGARDCVLFSAWSFACACNVVRL